MNNSPIPAAVYRRVSTDHQDGSLALQEHRVADYCRFKLLTTSEELTFADPDTSGRTPMLDRDGGRALLNRIKHGDVKHIVIAKLDRLGRYVKDALGVLEAFQQQNITLHIVDFGGETITTAGHMGKLIITVLLAVAEWEAAEIRDRVTKQARDLFHRHQLTGKVPYGYDVEYVFADQSRHLSPRALNATELQAISTQPVISKPLVDNVAEQRWIRWMSAQRPNMSLDKIARALNNLNVTTKLGKPWQCGSVDGVLSSRHTARLLQSDSDQLKQAA